MKGLLLLVCIIALATAQEEHLSYIADAEAKSRSTEQLIDTFAQKQEEIIRKVFGHYIEEQIRKWKRADISENVIREKVVDLVVGRNHNLYEALKKFVEEKLFAKLDMHLLVESLQQEIRLNPENYYLTFEVYDLLID